MATPVHQLASECPCHVFDVTTYDNKLHLADVRTTVKSRIFYDVPIFVLGEGIHSNRKDSMKNRVYSCVEPSKTKQFRLPGVDGTTIYMSISKSLCNHELVQRYKKMKNVSRIGLIDDIVKSLVPDMFSLTAGSWMLLRVLPQDIWKWNVTLVTNLIFHHRQA